MKRIPGLITLVFFAALTADASDFRAGAAASNITPHMGVPLDGTIMQTGPAKQVHDELWARCMVLSDGTTTLAIIVVDSTMISTDVHEAAKKRIESELGIPQQNICISATHTHSAPRVITGLVDDDLHRDYLDWVVVRIADGVRRAHNNLVTAEIGWGSFDEPRFVHNRRWFVKNGAESPFGETGEKVKMNPGANRDNLDRPAGPVDSEVFVMALRRAEDRQPIAIMGNYGLHYVGGVPGGSVSADYFGAYAGQVQKQWMADRLDPPFVGLMSNGTSGDVNANDFSGERKKYLPYERMNSIAGSLAEDTGQVLESLNWQTDASLDAAAIDLTLSVRKPDAERMDWADKAKAPDDTRLRLTRPQIYAREALFLADYPDAVTIPLQAFRIGKLAITQSPCETFAETGLGIKAESPFQGNTFTIELANGYAGYLPPEEQFEYGGYETWPARSSFLEPGAEGKIREGLLDLLTELKQRAE